MNKDDTSFYIGLLTGIIAGVLLSILYYALIRNSDTYYRDLIVNNPEAIAAIRSSELAQREEAKLLDD